MRPSDIELLNSGRVYRAGCVPCPIENLCSKKFKLCFTERYFEDQKQLGECRRCSDELYRLTKETDDLTIRSSFDSSRASVYHTVFPERALILEPFVLTTNKIVVCIAFI